MVNYVSTINVFDQSSCTCYLDRIIDVILLSRFGDKWTDNVGFVAPVIIQSTDVPVVGTNGSRFQQDLHRSYGQGIEHHLHFTQQR